MKCALSVVLSVSCMTLFPVPGHCDESDYGLRGGEPQTGSNVRKYLVKGIRVPMKKHYEQLTAEEKAVVIASYEHIDAGDEPPFPADGLRPIYVAILKLQEKLREPGHVTAVVTVDATGNPTSVASSGSANPEMANFVDSVLMLTRFKPAVCAGKPCQMDYPFTVELLSGNERPVSG